MQLVLLSIALFYLVGSCTSPAEKERVNSTNHFQINYTALDDGNIKEIADSLEVSYPKITAHLQSGDLPIVKVHFYESPHALKRAFPGMPDWAIGQAINVTEIHMLSPNHSSQDYKTMIRNTKHEFAHCVSMKINPTIANNPRWLWEAVADYEANLPWDPHMLAYMVNQQPPPIAALNNFSDPKIYEVGYFIAQFIDESYGASALRSLIQNNGDLKATLNLNEEEFTRKWFAFVKSKYSI